MNLKPTLRRSLLPAEPGTCALWWSSSRPHATLARLLPESEQRRAEGLRSPQARDHFVTARALLRLLIASDLGMAPQDVRIGLSCATCGSNAHGKPFVLGGSGPVAFSIAHADGRVVVALTQGRPVGVDIERVEDPTDPQRLTLVGAALARGERATWDRLPPGERARAATLWWTRKEAVLKGIGRGLAVAPHRVLVSSPGHPPALLGWAASDGPETPADADWPSTAAMRDLRPGPGYVGCVAALGVRPLDVVESDGDDVL